MRDLLYFGLGTALLAAGFLGVIVLYDAVRAVT